MATTIATPAAAAAVPTIPMDPLTELQQLTTDLYAAMLAHTSPSARPVQTIEDRMQDIILEDFDNTEPRDLMGRGIFRKATWALYRLGLLRCLEIIHRRYLKEQTEELRTKLTEYKTRIEEDFRSILPADTTPETIPYTIYQTARESLFCTG